jgi:hypothetical protein
MSISYECETVFWHQTLPGNAFLSSVREPMSAVSGLFIVGLSLWNGGLKQPRTRLSLAQASLFFCGVGTVAYHCITDETAAESHVNRNAIDGVTMAFFTVSVFSLHINMAKPSMLMTVVSILYLLFWIFTNDSDTFPFLCSKFRLQDGATYFPMLQYITFVLPYVYILLRLMRKCSTFYEHRFMWLALVFAGTSWLLYQYACAKSPWLFFTHALWHIGISYVSMYLIAIGTKETYKLNQIPGSSFWPQYYETDSQNTDTESQNGVLASFNTVQMPRIHLKI